MPRIDPHSLLECLSVLLNPKGGIKSKEDVARIVSLMSKFSKKLVSKCVYVEILHATDDDLLVTYMDNGGWELVSQWIMDAVDTNNGPLLETLLTLTKKSPLPLNLLEINDCPRAVKSLTGIAPNERVKALAAEIVAQWIQIAKQELKPDDLKKLEGAAQLKMQEAIIKENGVVEVAPAEDANQVLTKEEVELEMSKEEEVEDEEEEEEEEEPISKPLGELPVYKLTIRDGKHVLAKVSSGSAAEAKVAVSPPPPEAASVVKEGPKGAARRKQELKPKELLSSEEVEKKQKVVVVDKQVQEKVSAKRKREEEERRKEKLFKERQKKLKEKLAEREAKKAKEQKEKDEATLAQLNSTNKVTLGKIPKKSKAEDGEKKKDSDSDKNEKKSDSRRSSSDDDKKRKSSSRDSRSPVSGSSSSPLQLVKHKVKTFNSKFRSTGLEEESPLPPPRGQSKKELKGGPSTNRKRSPPPVGKEQTPPEKKNKLEEVVKKVSDKPKSKAGVQLLQESNFFMDALNATVKVEPRKRKRRISSSKDDTPPAKSSQSEKKAEKPSPSPTAVKPVFKFYTDTQEGNSKDGVEINEVDNNNEEENNHDEIRTPTPPAEGIVEEPSESSESDGTKSVLVIHRSVDRVKKTVRFKSDDDLVSIKYFELDETERVNVTKMGGDMKVSDAAYERDMFMNAKKRDRSELNRPSGEVPDSDSWSPFHAQPEVIENIPWRLIKVDCEGPIVEPGKDSQEKHVQAEREKSVLQAIYFSPESIPDCPQEPEIVELPPTEPRTIPLDDITGNLDSVKDFSMMPWVEPKGFAPPPAVMVVLPPPVVVGGGGWRTGDGLMLGQGAPEPAPFQPQQGFNAGYETGNPMGAPNFGYQTPNFNMPPDFSQMNGGMMPQGMVHPNMMPPNGAPPQNFMGFPPPNNNAFGGGPPQGNWGPMGFRGRGFNRGGRGFFAPRGGPRSNVCKHHARGFCRNGDTCKFKHQ